MRRVLACCAAIPVLIGCSGKPFGNLVALETGDLSHPLAERGVADHAIQEHCGDGALTEQGDLRLRRQPFVQSVTPQSAMVAFSGDALVGTTLRVTRPDGSLVTTARAELDGAELPPQYIAKLGNLEPGATYCYELPGLMNRAGFVTAPERDQNDTVHFVAWGDSGSGGPEQRAVLRQIHTVKFDLMLHLGDIAYEHGRPEELQARHFSVYAKLLRNFPMYAVAGNHDYATLSGEPLRQAFVLPENGGELGRERWYSFDWGPVHFVGLDTEALSTEQADWLRADLAQKRLPWTVVFGHRPPYSSGEHGSSLDVREAFGPILEAHGVDLVLSGHEHDYERTEPINGITYIVSGGGGRELRPVGTSSFTGFSESVLHFLAGEATANHLALHAIDGIGREFDQVYLTR
jgi:acid phosphatase type 7